MKTFETTGGFQMQLVAAEPLIRSPIVAAFDEDGNLFVGEMTDYPYNPGRRVQVAWQREHPPGEKPEGAVKMLRDTDGDGDYDKSTVFANELLWVGGIASWKGGVFVTAPPDIWYFKDIDGDDRADVREKVFTGFDMQRQQGFVNSLIFGLVVPLIGAARAGAQPVAEGARAATGGGISHHTIDANAGITVYRGGAYPEAYRGNVFTGDSVGNLVHRRVLVPQGAAFLSERADVGTEFVRSSDNWFRPVNFANAPDGTLYCIDMAREYSETVNIPADVEKQMDLRSGKNRGRIYRISPPGFKQPPPPRLSKASTAELVAALESPHGWWRETAHRLLYERQDQSAVPALEQFVAKSKSPQAKSSANPSCPMASKAASTRKTWPT